jgi:fatty-acyl-CoA synthase
MATRKKRAAGPTKSKTAKRRPGALPKKGALSKKGALPTKKAARKAGRTAKTKAGTKARAKPLVKAQAKAKAKAGAGAAPPLLKARTRPRIAKPAPGARRRPSRRLVRPQPRPVPVRTPRIPAAKTHEAGAYEMGLDRHPANYQPLTPLTFLRHAAEAHPETIAIIHGKSRFTYAQFYARSVDLAAALAREGIGKGDTVSVLLANTPAMLEAHHGVPMAGAVLNALNTRLDAPSVAYMLDHCEAKVLIADREFAGLAEAALKLAKTRPLTIQYDDPEFPQTGVLDDAIDYEAFIAERDADVEWAMPDDEWNAISLSYTSGTTGQPKGVVSHYRGAALMGYSNLLACRMGARPVYLWTLPMFHCNGWAFPWTLALVAGTHVCLRWVRARDMYGAIAEHKVTHLSGAPTVMLALLNAKPEEKQPLPHRVNFVHAAAPPPEAVLSAMLEAGFDLTHVYGLTETYGPATVNEWHPEWDALDTSERIAKRARQGVAYPALEGLTVLDPQTMEPAPRDGATLGEVMFRGNIVMKGYLKNPEATEEAFRGGWFHSGDLGVMHPDGYIQLKDRSKDIIISGGENISSIEVENVLYRHPAVMFAAVVAKPDEKWGETPCAFVERKQGFEGIGEAEFAAFCRENLAHFKCPKVFVFCELPKTTTGKIQKFRLREHAKTLL